MKSVAKPLSVVSTILYVAGIILTAFYLYRLPDKLIEHSSILDLVSIQEITPALSSLIWVVSLALLIGLVAIFSQVMQANQSKRDNIVYVEKFQSNSAASDEEAAEGEEQYETSSLDQDILQKIKEAAASKDTPERIMETALRAVCKQLEASQGAVYVMAQRGKPRFIELRASFAYVKPESQHVRFELGEGLPGQVAKEGLLINLKSVPDGYIKILSGLGKASPTNLLLIPIITKEKIAGVVEIASFTAFSKKQEEICRQAFAMLAKQFEASSSQIVASSANDEHGETFEEEEVENSSNI
jgi:predicted transcriptional regulator